MKVGAPLGAGVFVQLKRLQILLNLMKKRIYICSPPIFRWQVSKSLFICRHTANKYHQFGQTKHHPRLWLCAGVPSLRPDGDSGDLLRPAAAHRTRPASRAQGENSADTRLQTLAPAREEPLCRNGGLSLSNKSKVKFLKRWAVRFVCFYIQAS